MLYKEEKKKKMQSISRHYVLFMSMPPNFIRFHQKIGFESVLENFSSISRHLRTALNSRTFVTYLELNKVMSFDIQIFFLHIS